VANGFGFNVVKGFCIKTLEPMTEEAQMKTDRMIDPSDFHARGQEV
jgi:hypothetical protein